MEVTISSDSNSGVVVGQNLGSISFSASADKEAEAKILYGLSSAYRQQKDLNPRRTSGTCEWLLNDQRFVHWREALQSNLLHIYAAPGSGKSVLARCLIDEKLLSNRSDTPILYYFFKRGQGEQDRCTKAVAAMLHQLYVDFPEAAGDTMRKYMIPKYMKHFEKTFSMFSELFNTLAESAADISGGIVCVLDALDECEEQDREQLAVALETYFGTLRQRPLAGTGALKVLFTSRPDPKIEDVIGPQQNVSNIIRLDGYEKHELISQEIKRAIEEMVPNAIPRVSKQVHQEIIKHLQSSINRTYLWLHLALQHVKRSISGRRTTRKLKELIEELPPTLDEAYNHMLSSSTDPELTKSLLSIVIAAKRPLSISELSIALELTRCDYSHQWERDIDAESDDDFKNTVNGLSGALLSIYDSRVFFLHETARAFLLDNKSLHGNDDLPWKHCIHEGKAEALLAKACIAYLTLRDFNPGTSMSDAFKSKDPSDVVLVVDASDLFAQEDSPGGVGVFLYYAASYWVKHYRKIQTEIHDECAEQLRKIVPATSRMSHSNCWWEIYRSTYRSRMYNWAPLSFCAREGLHHLVRDLLVQGVDVDDCDEEEDPCALLLASEMGFVDIVRMLLQYRPNVNATDYNELTALHAASEEGHKEIVSLLIQHGADTNLRDNRGQTALQKAAQSGYLEIVQLLIQHGADTTTVDDHGYSALHEACRRGHIDIARILIHQGCDTGSQTRFEETPLHAASLNGQARAVQLLLEHGAPIDKQNRIGRTALHCAAENSCDDVFGLLLHNGADVSIRDIYGFTAIAYNDAPALDGTLDN